MLNMAATPSAVAESDLYLDFSGLHGTGQLSDIDVVIKEEDGEAAGTSPQSKRARLAPECKDLDERALVVPAHKMLLWSVSNFFKAKVQYMTSEWWITGNLITPTCLKPRSRERNRKPPEIVVCCQAGHFARSTLLPDRTCRQALQTNSCLQYLPLQLGTWSSNESSGKPKVDLLVPPGQTAIGKALIRAMYEKQPDLSALSQQQQLQLLQLADAYSVHKVSLAACNSLSSIKLEDLDWTTAAATFELPESVTQLPSFPPLKAAAVSRLMQKLGDLELVWRDAGPQLSDNQLLLVRLPLAALVELLRDERVKVSSENTVYHTITRWWEANPSSTQEQLQQLANLLRLPHCTPLYLSTVMCSSSSWLLKCFTSQDLFSACALAGSEKEHEWVAAASSRGPLIDHHPSWALPPRAESAVKGLVVKWNVPLEVIKRHFEAAVAKQPIKPARSPVQMVWKGRKFCLGLKGKSGGEAGAGASIVLGMQYQSNVPVDQMYIDGYISVDAREFERRVSFKMVLFQNEGFVMADALDSGMESTWEGAKAKLEENGIVHDDGCVHIRFSVKDLN